MAKVFLKTGDWFQNLNYLQYLEKVLITQYSNMNPPLGGMVVRVPDCEPADRDSIPSRESAIKNL